MPMLVVRSGSDISVRDAHFSNALSPIVDNLHESPKVTVLRDAQPENAYSAIETSLSGRVTDSIDEFWKAY